MDSKIALFDMDDTIADYMGQLVSDLKKKTARNVPECIDETASRELREAAHSIKDEAGWWEGLPPIASGIALMQLCKKIGFHIGISTQGPYKNRKAWGEKFSWCDKYVAAIDAEYTLMITRNGKGLVYGRIFVDDYPPYMLAWLENRPRGLGIMPMKPWNKDFTHPQVVKYDPACTTFSKELIDRLQQAFSREPGKT